MTVPPLVPTSLPWVYDLIVGQEWPAGDEDALRRCAQAWTEALGALVGIAEGGDNAARFVGYSVQSVSSDQFDSYWSKYTKGDDSVVGQMAQQCQGLAELLLQDAEQIEFTKLSINIQVVILAIQLTIDIATAIVTAGASMAEGAAATMAARFTVKQLLVELLKGALMAAAPDFITQTIMLAEGHRSSYDINETLQAAGQGALGAGIGMAVGGVTGKLASSLTEGLGEDAAKGLGGKLLTGVIHTGNAAVTGALTNMATTAVTDLAGGQSLDNVWGAGLNGAANGLLFHGAHTLGEKIGAAGRPEPTHFSLAGGGDLHGLPLSDGSYALFDPNGMKHGTGTFDPQSGQLTVRPVAGDPYRVGATAGERPAPVSQDPAPQHEDPAPAHDDPAPTQDGSAPARDDSAPARDGSAPARDDSAPAKDGSAPSHQDPAATPDAKLASLDESRPTSEQPVAQHSDPEPAGGPHAEPGSSPEPTSGSEPVPNAAPAPGPAPGEPIPADGSPQGSAPHPSPGEPAPVGTPPYQGPDSAPARTAPAPTPDPAPVPPSGRPDPTPEPPSGRPDPTREPPSVRPDPTPEPPSGRPDPTPEPPSGQPGPTPEPPHGGSGPNPDPQPIAPQPTDPQSLGTASLATAGASTAGASTADLAAAEPTSPAAPGPLTAPVEQPVMPSAGNPPAAMPDAVLATGRPGFPSAPASEPRPETVPGQEPSPRRPTGNRILDELNAAAAPTRQEQRPEVFSSLGGPTRDLTPKTPEVGKWTSNDADWQNIWNKAKSSLPPDQVLEQWSQGAPAPNARTHQDLINEENGFLGRMEDPQRRSFHSLVADVLEERHNAVKPVLDEVLKGMGTGELRGLDHHRKFAESLDRKFGPDLDCKGFPKDLAALTPEARAQAVADARAKLNGLALDVNDPLRYTMVFDEANYARGAREALKALHEAGYRLLDVTQVGDEKAPGARPLLLEDGKLPPDAAFAKNFWREGNRYLGINLTLVDEHGGPFELQFHTPRSFDLKQYLSHEPYEVFRKDGTPPERRVNSMLELVAMSDTYLRGHVPGNLEEFAPKPLANGLDPFFEKLVAKHAGDAKVAAAVDFEHREIRAVNLELADQLNAVAKGGLSDEASRQAIGEIAGLVQARAELLGAQSESPHLGSEPAEQQHQNPAAHTEPGEHTGPGEHTALGPSVHEHTPPGDPAGTHHPTLHLEHPVPVSEDHLVFPFRDDQGNLAWAHLQHTGGRWVLHAGGPEGEHLTSLAENLRTPPPGLDLIGHATPEGFLIGGKTVPFEDVLAHIPHTADGEGPIRLIACDAGGATGEAAQRLADLSGRKVIAADSTVWVAEDGGVLASNPVDRATNWYPKRPPDGVWKEYEPGTRLAASGSQDQSAAWEHVAPKTLAADDPRLPGRPRGWEVSDQPLLSMTEGADRPEFTDLGVKPKELPEPIRGDRWAADAALLANQLGRKANLEFAVAARRYLDGVKSADVVRRVADTWDNVWQQKPPPTRPLSHDLRFEIAALRPEALEQARKYAKPTYKDPNGGWTFDEKSIVNGVEQKNKQRPGLVLQEKISIAGIEVTQTINLPKKGEPHPARILIDFPDDFHSYADINKRLADIRSCLAAAKDPTPDRSIARALMDLLNTDESVNDASRRRGIEALAKTVEANGGPGLKPPLDAAKVVALGGALAHLIGHVEPARDSRALSNLVNLDVAARGGMTITDAVKYFNPVHQAGGGHQAEEVYHRVEREDPPFEGPNGKSFQEVKEAFVKKRGSIDADYTLKSFTPLVEDFHFDKVWLGDHGDTARKLDGPKVKTVFTELDAQGKPVQIKLWTAKGRDHFLKSLSDYADESAAALTDQTKQKLSDPLQDWLSKQLSGDKTLSDVRDELAKRIKEDLAAQLYVATGGENWAPIAALEAEDSPWEVEPRMRGTAPGADGFLPNKGSGTLFQTLSAIPDGQWSGFVHRLGLSAGIDQTLEIQLRQRNALARFLMERQLSPKQTTGASLFETMIGTYGDLLFPPDYPDTTSGTTDAP